MCGEIVSATLDIHGGTPPPSIETSHHCVLPVSGIVLNYGGASPVKRIKNKYFTQIFAAKELGISKQRISVLVKQKRIKTKNIYGLGVVIEREELKKFKRKKHRWDV